MLSCLMQDNSFVWNEPANFQLVVPNFVAVLRTIKKCFGDDDKWEILTKKNLWKCEEYNLITTTYICGRGNLV